MKSSAMLDSNTSTSVKPQKASLPIARTNGPGYERPERARTSHACEPCRERKTKCDGERPSCRRCLHTGTSCHYGYGKGWRKRKTAEDLNATSKKLQRYEALLNEITPMVPPDVRAMIEEVRQQVIRRKESSIFIRNTNIIQETSANSPSEANESSTSSMTTSLTPSRSIERERSGSGPVGRLPLTLPMPGNLGPPQSRSQPPLPFDRVSESTSPHLAHHPKREPTFEELSNNRLPSITPNGVLIENGARDPSPNYSRPAISTSHTAAEPFSPPTGSSFGVGSPKRNADDWVRSNPWSAFGLSDLHHRSQHQSIQQPHLTV